MSNSERIHSLIRDGKLYLSLDDTIALALENNLDIALSRHSLDYAQTDILRTKAGGAFRGIHPSLFGGVTAFSGGGFARRDFGLWLAGDSGGPLDWDSGRLIGLARGAAEALTGR